jgi:hypothetical protein
MSRARDDEPHTSPSDVVVVLRHVNTKLYITHPVINSLLSTAKGVENARRVKRSERVACRKCSNEKLSHFPLFTSESLGFL